MTAVLIFYFTLPYRIDNAFAGSVHLNVRYSPRGSKELFLLGGRKPGMDVIKVGPCIIFSRNRDVVMLGGGASLWGGNNLP